jgi:UDP-N-acetylglucosamine 4-epimerase
MLIASRDNRVRRFVYASSSAVYGDDTTTPAQEDSIGEPLSPYGASKRMAELYAGQFGQHYSLECMGLRYFNVFGPRQNPIGGYAAVIPQWIDTLIRGRQCRIHGDGSNTRDFCPVENIVQANILAATVVERSALGQVYNVALGGSTTLNELYAIISQKLAAHGIEERPVEYTPPRPGDIAHSSADTAKVCHGLGFIPEMNLDLGLENTVRWFVESAKAAGELT